MSQNVRPYAKVAEAKVRTVSVEEQSAMEDRIDDEFTRRKEDESKERNRADKVSKFLGGQQYLIDARPTHVIPRAKLEKFSEKQLMALPMTWYFSRFYQSLNVITDLFPTKAAYDAAEVDKRREWCKDQGIKYAALGPTDTTTDLAPQLGLAK